jgi:catechol 2,3-dioxygenase-like lactoylglutathione lyase family enzyme
MTPTGLQHVALETRESDAPAEVAFWALLGFSAVDPPGALTGRATWVQASDGTQIHLLYASNPVVMPEGHVAVVTPPPFETTIAALEAAGHAPEPRAQHWGVPRSYVRTPAGHLIELMASPPTITPA